MSEPGRLARLRDGFGKMIGALKADYETQCDFDSRYGGRQGEKPSPLGDVVKRVGLQVSIAYRVMQFFHEGGVPLAPQVVSRLIRHAYGSDIHWAAKVGPGVLLFQNVTLGSGVHPETRESGAPTIEHDVHIGPGAVIIGPVTIGARSKIMANCVVTTSIPPDSLVEAPAPNVRPRLAGRSAKAAESGSRRAR
jgi:serine acetyltransferase